VTWPPKAMLRAGSGGTSGARTRRQRRARRRWRSSGCEEDGQDERGIGQGCKDVLRAAGCCAVVASCAAMRRRTAGVKLGGKRLVGGGRGDGATHDRMDKDPASFWVVTLGARIFCNMWERC
jgi:hypothetical protein